MATVRLGHLRSSSRAIGVKCGKLWILVLLVCFIGIQGFFYLRMLAKKLSIAQREPTYVTMPTELMLDTVIKQDLAAQTTARPPITTNETEMYIDEWDRLEKKYSYSMIQNNMTARILYYNSEKPKTCTIPCEYTEDHSKLHKADALVFHIPTAGSIPTPRGHVLTVAYSMESEEIYTKLKDPNYMSQFDLTMTYKLDSDIIAPYFGPNLSYFMRPPIPKGTTQGLAVFVASNCGAKERQEYVEELMKYIKVDSYGRCLHNMEFPETGESRPMQKYNIMKKYKFALAFESHRAVDYVTEKFFHTLSAGSIPVYMGAPNIDKFVPAPHSIINVDEFGSPKDLAEYMLYLDQHDDKYQEYFKWKEEGPSEQFLKLISLARLDARCRLCIKVAEHLLKSNKPVQ